MTNIASRNQEFVNSLLGNTNRKMNVTHITFYRTYSGLGLLISKAHVGSYLAIATKLCWSANLNKWHVISITWSDKRENLRNCWSNGEELISFTTGNIKGYDCCYLGNLGKIPGWNKTHLTVCIGETIELYKTLKDQETLYIHEYLMRKWEITDA